MFAFKIFIYIAWKDNTLKIHIVIQNAYKALSAGIQSYTVLLGFGGKKKTMIHNILLHLKLLSLCCCCAVAQF